MPTLVKNMPLTRKRRIPESTAKLVDLSSPCARCASERRVTTMTFHYSGTDGTGKSFEVNWCPFHQTEV
jgi:hypothetical protein